MNESTDFDEFSVRAKNTLYSNGIYTFESLIQLNTKELLRLRGMGRKTMREVRHKLAEKELCLRDDVLITDMSKKNFFMSIPEYLSNFSCAIKNMEEELRILRVKMEDIIYDEKK